MLNGIKYLFPPFYALSLRPSYLANAVRHPNGFFTADEIRVVAGVPKASFVDPPRPVPYFVRVWHGHGTRAQFQARTTSADGRARLFTVAANVRGGRSVELEVEWLHTHREHKWEKNEE
jgi:hypothetical protein